MGKANLNMAVLSVNEIVEQLSSIYCGFIEKNLPLSSIPTAILYSSPGVGKSSGVLQIAKAIERTGKKCKVKEIRLVNYSPIDLTGLPCPDKNKTSAVWLKPEIFNLDPSGDVVNILFLDEITACSQAMQSVSYALCLDKKVGTHRLPENTIVIAAGNKVTDKAVAYTLSTALSNRLMHFEVRADFESWKDWGIKNGISRYVLGFLSFRPDLLNAFDPASGNYAFPTPRSWTMVSTLLEGTGKEPKELSSAISGCIGTGAALEFIHWCDVFGDLPEIEAIFKGKSGVKMPSKPDRLYALVSAMTAYASGIKENYEYIENAIEYACGHASLAANASSSGKGMPAEFQMLFIRNLMSLEKGYTAKLKANVPAFIKFIQTKGALLNAVD